MPSRILAAFLVVTFAAPALAAQGKGCPKGQVASHGVCKKACTADAMFADPAACECPKGFGKVLLGGGGGECQRLACPQGKDFDPTACECPSGLEKKIGSKGKARCVTASAAAKAPVGEKDPAAK
jgi:hypothetical protein